MVFLELAEYVVAIIFLIFVVTQILVPLGRGLPYFPAFRKSTKKLEEDLEGAKEEVKKAEIEAMLEEEKTKAEKIRKSIKRKEKINEQ